MLNFIIGMMVGALLGIFTMALCVASSKNSEYEEYKEYELLRRKNEKK